MATHSSILAWTIPWTEEPGGLQFMGSQSNSACTHGASSWLSPLAQERGPHLGYEEQEWNKVSNASELYVQKWSKWKILCYVYFTAKRKKEENKINKRHWGQQGRATACWNPTQPPRKGSHKTPSCGAVDLASLPGRPGWGLALGTVG